MAHSCVVNVQLSFENNSTMVVKTTEPIEKGQGIFVSIANNCTAHLLKIKFYFYSDVKVSYIDPLQTTLQRRKVLAKRFSPKIIAGSIAMKDPNFYLYFFKYYTSKHFICRCRRCNDPTECDTFSRFDLLLRSVIVHFVLMKAILPLQCN